MTPPLDASMAFYPLDLQGLSETGKLRNFITPMLFNINKMVFSAYYSYLAIKFRD